MDRGAWWATVHGVAKSRTRLSDFTSLHFTSWNKADLRLRWPHAAQNRSRDLPRKIRGLWCKPDWVFWAAECCLHQEYWDLVFHAGCLLRIWSLDQPWAWTSEVGDSSPRLWTTRELSTTGIINRWEPQKASILTPKPNPPKGQQVPVSRYPTSILQQKQKHSIAH